MARSAYFELAAGAAGDMLLGAALDALVGLSENLGSEKCELELECSAWLGQMSGLLALEPNAQISLKRIVRGGLASIKVDFFVGETHADHYQRGSHESDNSAPDAHEHTSDHQSHSHAHRHSHDHGPHHAHGRHLHQIEKILLQQGEAGHLSEAAVNLACKIFSILAVAEAKVHGTTIERVHFHEVGAFDAIMDIAGFASAWTMLNCELVCASPVTLGSGTIQTQHGAFGVPAPAVVEIVREYAMPVSDLLLPGECLTPTGAACLAAVVSRWGTAPPFSRVLCQGLGAGTRESKAAPNVVRLIVGETA